MQLDLNLKADGDGRPAVRRRLLDLVALELGGRRLQLAAGQVLWPQDVGADQLFLVEHGLLSLRWSDPDGEAAEVELIGPGGAAGLAEVLGRGPALCETRALLPTAGLLVAGEAMRELAAREAAVAALCWRQALEQQVRLRRAAGCAARHGLRARLADYLLALQAAAPGALLSVTQEELAAALGVYRTTVTALLGQFADEGLVATGRGRLSVRDPSRLGQAACGCQALHADFNVGD